MRRQEKVSWWRAKSDLPCWCRKKVEGGKILQDAIINTKFK